jgi:hypothetical protein
LAPTIDNVEILRPIPQLMEDHSIVGQTIDMQQQQYAFLVQQHAQNSLQAMFANNIEEHQQQITNMTQRKRKDENCEMFERRNNNHTDDDYDEEDDEEMDEDREGNHSEVSNILNN